MDRLRGLDERGHFSHTRCNAVNPHVNRHPFADIAPHPYPNTYSNLHPNTLADPHPGGLDGRRRYRNLR